MYKYTINSDGRVVALRDFGNVKAGDVGGFVESEDNLSHDGDCWVYDDAWVCGNARVSGNAWVYDDARVSGNAQVFGKARVFDSAWVYVNAQVSGTAWVFGNAGVTGDAQVYGNARVFDNARVFGNARVSGNAEVYVNAQVSGDIGDISVCGELKNKYSKDISEDKVVSAVSAGGPAFPVPDSHHANGQVQYGANGMTLRDWFATHATEADILAAQGAYRVVTRYEARYIHADEMLKARGQG